MSETREAPKLCKDCRWHFSSRAEPKAPQEICTYKLRIGFDLVYGKTTLVYGKAVAPRDCYDFRKSFTDVGSHPIPGNCGYEAVFFEARTP